ncbi:MAG TPA: CoA transferase [Acidimicrobiales bacterium]|nr:CoA transferase [Acidimicrobiales bacterium]
MADALDGLRVLDLSTYLAAPQISAILGDFGADVVKVEPPHGDPMRRLGAHRQGTSLLWELVARNKRSVVIDTGTAEGVDRLQRLTAAAGVVVVNQPSELLERWGCTPAAISARNPGVVVVSVSCYGADGPYAGRSGAGSMAEAFAGLTGLTGAGDGPPVLAGVPIGDTLVALSGVIGTLLACYHRDAGDGTGQHVDVSMFEPILTLLGPVLAGWDPAGPPPRRSGSRIGGGVPRNVYRASDGTWLAVSGTTDDQVGRLLPLLGRDGPDDRARFGRSADRLRAADELDGLVAGWIGSMDGPAALVALAEARIPAAPVNDLAGVIADPHVRARRSILEIGEGPVLVPGPSPRLGTTPGRLQRAAPTLGDGEAAVLRTWLPD